MIGHTEYFIVRDVIYKYLPPTVRRIYRISRDIITYTAYLIQVLHLFTFRIRKAVFVMTLTFFTIVAHNRTWCQPDIISSSIFFGIVTICTEFLVLCLISCFLIFTLSTWYAFSSAFLWLMLSSFTLYKYFTKCCFIMIQYR